MLFWCEQAKEADIRDGEEIREMQMLYFVVCITPYLTPPPGGSAPPRLPLTACRSHQRHRIGHAGALSSRYLVIIPCYLVITPPLRPCGYSAVGPLALTLTLKPQPQPQP